MAQCRQGWIYPAKKNNEYSKKYNHYLCCMDVPKSCWMVDCIPRDEHGNQAPGFECGVPTLTEKFYSTYKNDYFADMVTEAIEEAKQQ